MNIIRSGGEMLRTAIAAIGGAELVGAIGGSVQHWINVLSGGPATQYADRYLLSANPIMQAINALPATGGIVRLSNRAYPPVRTTYDAGYISKPNLSIQGSQKPSLAANCDRLEGGSIIQGRFNVWADNFTIENVGIDAGKYVVDTHYGGLDTHSANNPDGGNPSTWDGFAFAQPNGITPLPAVRNFTARNLIGLNRDSLSFGHAVLMEGFNGGLIDNVQGVYGVHALVIKAENVMVGSVAGYAASVDHVIIKSDTYAKGANVQINSVSTDAMPPGISAMWSPPAVCSFGLYLHAATADLTGVKISKARLKGATALLRGNADSVARNMDNVMISSLECAGIGMANAIGINFSGATFDRIRLGSVTISNCADGIAYQQLGGFSDDALEIDALKLDSISLRGIQARNFGRLVINHLRAVSVVGMYAIDDTARIHVGRESLSLVTNKFTLNPPSLTAGWQQLAGNSTFRLALGGYGVELEGLLQPTGTPSAHVINLPPYLKPVEPVRMMALSRDGANIDAARFVKLGGENATLSINDGAGIVGAENFLSLDNLSYRLD